MQEVGVRTKGFVLIASVLMWLAATPAYSVGKGGMKATVDKLASALMQTAADQFKAKQDSLGAATCIKVYDLDNSAYREYLIKAGEGFERYGAKETAKKAYETYLQKHGADPGVVVRLASLEYSENHYGRVVEILKQAPIVAFSQEHVCMMLAESHYALGQYDETAALLLQSKNQKTRRQLELLALASEKMGEYTGSLSYYDKLLALPPDKKRRQYDFHIALLYEELNQNDKAIRRYEQNLVEFPGDFPTYERLAALYLQMRDFPRAQQVLQKAVELPEAQPVLRKMLGQSLAAQGNRIAAINWYKQYLAQAPADSGAWCELGAVYFQEEHYQEAIDVLKKAVAVQPKNEECLITLGTCYTRTGDLAASAGPLEQARQINKYDVRVLSQLALCYRAQHDTQRLSGVLRDWSIAEPKNSKPKFELGDMFVGEQKYRDAIPLLESACGMDSANAEIHLSLAKSYEKTGNEANRLLHLKRAIACSPVNAEAMFEFGRFLSGRNQMELARPYFLKAVSMEPGNAVAQFEYGKVLKAVGQQDSACEHLSAALRADPLNTSYAILFAQASYATGRKEIALDYLRKALSRDSLNTELLQWAGILYKESGSVDTAKQLLLRAITLNKSCASCFKCLGDIYLANAEYDLAVKFYNQSLDIGTFSEAAALGLGASLFLSGDLDRAGMMFEKVLSENPKGEEALYRLCAVYIRSGMLDKAKELFGRVKDERNDGWIRLTEGEIAEAEGRPDAALLSFTAASTLMPDNPLAHAAVGRISLMNNNYEKAVEHFGNAIGRDPHNVDFLMGMGKAYEGLGQNQAAFDLYAEVARKAPRNPEVFYLLGHVLSKQNQHAESVAALMRGLELNPRNAQLYFGLGHEYRALSKFKESLAAYKKSVSNKIDEGRFLNAYKEMGNIYLYGIKDTARARDCYNKFIKAGGKDDKVVQLVNTLKG